MSEPTKITPARNRGGEWVTIGDVQYRIPPLGFREVKNLQTQAAQLAAIAGGTPTAEQMDVVVDIVHAAISRNYDIQRSEVEDMLDLGNFGDILDAVLGIAGFKRGPAGAGSGETMASTGTTSTSP